MKLKLLFLVIMITTVTISFSQNLLDTSSWSLGSGSVTGFSANGGQDENWRILGEDHLGESLIIWEARNDAASGPDGGWHSSYKTIDNSKTYRFAVWIKKTNSHDGRTYFGCRRTNGILRLDGAVNNNPYFWNGDLPKLDRWYLLIGYVHHKNYNLTQNDGIIYDGITGLPVANLSVTDYKFSSSATSVQHRAYLYYDANVDDRQYFMKPRIEEVNGQEPTILELLNINSSSTLNFEYDTAGNQKLRRYCEQGFCFSSSPTKTFETRKTDSLLAVNQEIVEGTNVHSEGLSPQDVTTLDIYPNPTTKILNFVTDKPIVGVLHMTNTNSQIVKSFENYDGTLSGSLDIGDLSQGVYILHIHYENGTRLLKKFIKN